MALEVVARPRRAGLRAFNEMPAAAEAARTEPAKNAGRPHTQAVCGRPRTLDGDGFAAASDIAGVLLSALTRDANENDVRVPEARGRRLKPQHAGGAGQARRRKTQAAASRVTTVKPHALREPAAAHAQARDALPVLSAPDPKRHVGRVPPALDLTGERHSASRLKRSRAARERDRGAATGL